LDNKNQNGLDLQLYTCNGTPAQQYTFRSDSTIYNPNTNKCVDNKNGNGLDLQLWVCNGFNAQKFVMQDNGMIYSANTNKCFDNNAHDNVTIDLWACYSGADNETFSLPNVTRLVDFALPPGAGKAVKVATDQWFVSVLTDTGQVWSAGRNEAGQLGNGQTKVINPYPVRFILPSGVTATDIWSTAYYGAGFSFANTFVIGSDGKVYGAGDNDYGQLGDGTTTDRSTPVAMQVIDGVGIEAKKVQSGMGTTVVYTKGKKVYTVGNNSNGQLGDGTTNNSSTPKANKYTNVLPLAIF
jgi:alpha-tubulin suppressor-like RCC1 family protein